MKYLIWVSSWENVSSGVCDQVRLKLACSTTEASIRLEILVTETRDITLSRQRTTKALTDCADAQVDLHLCCSHMTWHVFSLPGSYIVWHWACLMLSGLIFMSHDSFYKHFVHVYVTLFSLLNRFCNLFLPFNNQLWCVKRICVFEHSVMTNFNCACPAIQRGQGFGFLFEGSSWLIAYMSEQWRFWRDCADAQARLNHRCSHRRYVPNSLDMAQLIKVIEFHRVKYR